MLLAQLPEVAQKPVFLGLQQEFVVFQCAVGQHNPDDFLEGTSPGAADGRQKADDDVFLVEVLDLQIIEPLRPLLAGKELDVLLNDGLVLLIDPQVH